MTSIVCRNILHPAPSPTSASDYAPIPPCAPPQIRRVWRQPLLFCPSARTLRHLPSSCTQRPETSCSTCTRRDNQTSLIHHPCLAQYITPLYPFLTLLTTTFHRLCLYRSLSALLIFVPPSLRCISTHLPTDLEQLRMPPQISAAT